MKNGVALLITFAAGFILIISTFIPPWKDVGENVSQYFQIIGVFAFFLGGGSLIKLNIQKISTRARDWEFAIVTLIGFFIMLAAGVFKIGNEISADLQASGTLFTYLFDSIKAPLSATMYSLLAFYISSASYRAFRAKNSDAVMLLIAAFVILMGQTFVGVVMTGWLPEWLSILKVENLSFWLMSVPNQAGQRAILIGIALGIISMSLRVIIGIERTHLSGGDE